MMLIENLSDTIVECSSSKEVYVDYPNRIVSPPHPGDCCFTRMDMLGEVQWGDQGPYLYKRCVDCGYTVRFFPGQGPSFNDVR